MQFAGEVGSRRDVNCEGKWRPANEAEVKTSAENFLSAGISLKLLRLIKWRDKSGEEQSLINRVCSKWESFGCRLEIPQIMLDIWREECLYNLPRCWLKVMEYWLTGGETPDYPATWDGLYKLLEDVEFDDVAWQLRNAVLAATRDGECCSQLHVGIYSCSVCASLPI